MDVFEKAVFNIETELGQTWEKRRVRSLALADIYSELEMVSRAVRVAECGTVLEFVLPENANDTPKLHGANFCKDRLCAMCAWRRSLKIFAQVSQVMDVICNDYRFLFVTLTVRNCSADELPATMNHLQQSFNRLMCDRAVKKSFRGYFKAYEITRRPGNTPDIEYHPHIHCIFAVSLRYFKGENYISYEKLRQLWQRCLQVSYPPQVDIRAIKPDTPGKFDNGEECSMANAVAEVAKYSVKSDQLFTGSMTERMHTVLTMLEAITSRRLCAFGGIFKKTAAELKLDDMLDGDLVITDGQKLRTDVAQLIATYKWTIGFGYRIEHIGERTNDR